MTLGHRFLPVLTKASAALLIAFVAAAGLAQSTANASKKDAKPAADAGAMPFNPLYMDHSVKPRVVVTTDGEIDDRCSMIRFLLYSNEFDVEAIIYNSSMFHWLGQT